MTISAQRMQFLDQETNLGLANLVAIDTPDVYNAAINQIDEVTAELSEFIESAQQSASSAADQLKSVTDSAVRATRDAFTSLTDMTGMAESKIQSMIAGMLPNNPLFQNTFSNITKQCRNNALGRNIGFKPYRDRSNCASGRGSLRSGKCQIGDVGGLLSQITGGLIGAIGAVAGALSGMLKKLISLASMGYDIGLCKVFGALSDGMPKNIIQRGAASLLATTGLSGNTRAVLDIASNMGSAIPSMEIPGLVGMAMDNFRIPDGFRSQELGSLGEGYMTAMEAVTPGWNVSSIMDESDQYIPDYSKIGVGTQASPDMVQVSGAASSLSFFDPNDPESAEIDEYGVLHSALISEDADSQADAYF